MANKATITQVSPKYQIAIPLEVRRRADIRPGTRFEIVLTDSGLRLIRLGALTSLRGRVRRDEGIEIREEHER